jgi:hypothetical protein
MVETDYGYDMTISSERGTYAYPIYNGNPGEKGDKGDPGKSAYEYAKEGGYAGTEEAFGKKLASDDYVVVHFNATIDENKILDAVAEGKPVYCLYLAYFLPLVHWTNGYSFGGCYDNKIVTVKYANGAWSVSEETVGESGGSSDVFIATDSTTQAEMNESYNIGKVIVYKRGVAGGYKLYYHTSNWHFFCVYGGVTEEAVYNNGTWTFSTVEGGAGNVFIGDENTTVAEYYEAYQNKKACFMYRSMGPSGNNMWTMYKANMYNAFFRNINDKGDVLYGVLKSDGTWSYQTKTASGGEMQPLTFTGAVNATYDGSEAVEVEIPEGGSGGGDGWSKLVDMATEEDVSELLILFDGDTLADEIECHMVFASSTANTEEKSVEFKILHDKKSTPTRSSAIIELPSAQRKSGYVAHRVLAGMTDIGEFASISMFSWANANCVVSHKRQGGNNYAPGTKIAGIRLWAYTQHIAKGTYIVIYGKNRG